MKKRSVRRLVFSAALAAVYAALTVATGFMSYGNIQLRIAEALCVLPALFPFTTWGLFVGCILANLVSPTGMLDVVFGSLATLVSCCCVSILGRGGKRMGRSIIICLMPVFWNALILGAMFAFAGEYSWVMFPMLFALYGGEIALGEALVMFALGLPLLRWLPGSRWYPALRERLDTGE